MINRLTFEKVNVQRRGHLLDGIVLQLNGRIDEQNIPVEDIGLGSGGETRQALFYRVGIKQLILAIQKHTVVSGSPLYALVHGIIDTHILFTHPVAQSILALGEEAGTAIRGCSVNYYILNLRPLSQDALHGLLEPFCVVAAYGYD
jgi:hypothetical protein